MAELGSATLKITTDTTPVENTLRTIAKHFTALADELGSTRTGLTPASEHKLTSGMVYPERQRYAESEPMPMEAEVL